MSDRRNLHRVYCAGPLFNQAERDEMTAIADLLCEAGYAVYLPHRDGMEFRHVLGVLVEQGWDSATAGRFLHGAIFALDIYQLVEACDSVVWNLNGRTPDEGAVSEAAIAWTLGKPLLAFKEDVRSLIAGRDNPLLAGLVEFETIDTLADIPTALAQILSRSDDEACGHRRLPAQVQQAVDNGRELWSALQQNADPKRQGQQDKVQASNVEIARVVTRLFATQLVPDGAPNVIRT